MKIIFDSTIKRTSMISIVAPISIAFDLFYRNSRTRQIQLDPISVIVTQFQFQCLEIQTQLKSKKEYQRIRNCYDPISVIIHFDKTIKYYRTSNKYLSNGCALLHIIKYFKIYVNRLNLKACVSFLNVYVFNLEHNVKLKLDEKRMRAVNE